MIFVNFPTSLFPLQVDVKLGQYFENSLNVYRDKRAANMLLLTKPVDRTA